MNDIQLAFQFISLGYILTVIIITYVLIKFIDGARKTRLSTKLKRIASFAIGIVIGYVYFVLNLAELGAIIPSYCLTLIGYDYFIKEILRKFEPVKGRP